VGSWGGPKGISSRGQKGEHVPPRFPVYGKEKGEGSMRDNFRVKNEGGGKKSNKWRNRVGGRFRGKGPRWGLVKDPSKGRKKTRVA